MAAIELLGGIGGIGAVFGFLMYLLMKKLLRQMRDDRKFMEDRLTNIINQYHDDWKSHERCLGEFTKILYELTFVLKHNRSD